MLTPSKLLPMAASLRGIAERAAQAVMEIYELDENAQGIRYKNDASPVTKADETSHKIIAENIGKQFEEIPILSEEGGSIPYAERRDWDTFFCVDPLDGTKEFISRNGDFCINIALISNRRPVLGVIHLPVHDTVYWGGESIGAYQDDSPIQTAAPTGPGVMVQSRSHPDPDLTAWAEQNGCPRIRQTGAARKFCLIAEGKAHYYPRFNPTMEWDTAAGHAILEGAGGSLTTHDGQPFLYNKENLKNGGFMATWSPDKR